MTDEYPDDTATVTASPVAFKTDAFIPLVILSISFIILLSWQVSVSSEQRTMLENTITRQVPAVNQAQQVQTSVSKLAADLLEAAQTDDTAKAITDKFKIQQNVPAASASPSP